MLLWHQHQPLYLDAVKDELQGPWVRKLAACSARATNSLPVPLSP